MKKIAVLGAGLMGHGIAQVFASAGHQVRLYDSHPAVLEGALERIGRNLQLFVEMGVIEADASRICLDNIRLCPELGQACEDGRLIIEAIPEDLELKRNLLAAVERLVSADTILCSNTSAISITELGSRLDRPERLLGTHFWNPPHVLPCVEVIRGESTSMAVFDEVVAILGQAGKVPVRVNKDIPGFIGNRLQHALQREALYLLEQGICGPEDLDNVVKHGFGLRYALMGPLERADMAGLEVTFEVQKYLLPHLDTRTGPSPILQEKVSRRQLGIKTGQGFYTWTPERIREAATRRDRLLIQLMALINPK